MRIRTLKPAGIEFRDAPPASEIAQRPHIEQRFIGLEDLTITDADARTFEGYGCRFGVVDAYRTVFERGCFAESLSEWRSEKAWPSFYLQHDWDLIVGGWNDMYEDNNGLFVKGDFLNSAWGEHARALVKEKRARGLSIGFVPIASRVENEDDWEKRIRYITKAQLWEVSLVERAAVPGSGVTAIRSDMSTRDVERVLSTVPGVTRDAAKVMAGALKAKGMTRDASQPEPEATPEEIAAREASEREATERGEREARAAREAKVNESLITSLQGAARVLQR